MQTGTYTACAQACNVCADACDHCLSACLLEPDVKTMTGCIALDLECAAMCRLLAGFASRGSKFAPGVAGHCAELCRACAAECGKHAHDHCKACAEACNRCAQACEALASMNVAPVDPAQTNRAQSNEVRPRT